MDSVQSALLTLTALALVIGLLWPTATRWPVLRHLIAFRAYRKLYPLWQAYVEAEPDIAFDDTAKVGLRDIELRLVVDTVCPAEVPDDSFPEPQPLGQSASGREGSEAHAFLSVGSSTRRDG